MPWHREDGPDDTSAHASLEDVKDVLYAGKTKSDKDGIDDAIHVLVEVLVPPKEKEQDGELAQFLAETGFDKGGVEN